MVEPTIDLTDGVPAVERAPREASVAHRGVRLRRADGSWVGVRVLANEVDGARRGTARRGAFVAIDADATPTTSATTKRFAEIVERDPAASLVLELLDRNDPTTLVIRAANAAARDLFRLEDRPGVDGSASSDGQLTTPIDAVLGVASGQLLRSAVFDVVHTGASITAERLALSEVPGASLDLRVERLSDGSVSVVLHDVTATAALEERLRHQASHDALTGLPNRALFEDRLASALAAASDDAPAALVLVDIEGLSSINDSHGLHLGDDLLVQVGHRLAREVRGASVVSRLGGDEFAVLTRPCTSEAEATERSAAVRSALTRPFELEGDVVAVRCDVGVALSTSHPDDARALLRSAYEALVDAKRNGTHFALHERDGTPGSIQRVALLSELRQGLANRDLELRYQPVVDLRSGTVDRVEAVLRWRDDAGAQIGVEFLELAEQSGLIRPLTRWILGEAADAANLLARGGDPLVVSTNLSLQNLFDPDLVAFVGLLISSGELDPALVELEVCETELMDDPVRATEVLERLGALGLGVVVDEFGTGYTSLATMQLLPVQGLKIDRSCLATIATDAADAAIVRSTIELCHELGLGVGAEGVGDDATLELLAGFGCDRAQGRHLCEAVTLDELPERIAALEEAVRGWVGSAEVR